MATRRTNKKTEPVAAPIITQVVEEVPEEKPAEVIVAAEKLEEVLPEEVHEESPERQVVSELYKPTLPDFAPEITAESGSPTKSLLVWSLVVIGIALLTGGTLLVAVKGFQGVPLVARPTPTPTPGPTSTPTPAVANRSDIKVQVLNGGGVSGSAGKMKAFLEEKGYSVEAVGNAEEFTFEETEILVKPGKEAYLDLLKKDLEEIYTIGSASAGLSADSPYDAQVIVGKK